jgi:cell division protein ZapB
MVWLLDAGNLLASLFFRPYYRAWFSPVVEVCMDLLDQLEQKITLALETIELLNMENEELKQEVSALQQEKVMASEQKKVFEEKITGLLKQFEDEPSVSQLAANG